MTNKARLFQRVKSHNLILVMWEARFEHMMARLLDDLVTLLRGDVLVEEAITKFESELEDQLRVLVPEAMSVAGNVLVLEYLNQLVPEQKSRASRLFTLVARATHAVVKTTKEWASRAIRAVRGESAPELAEELEEQKSGIVRKWSRSTAHTALETGKAKAADAFEGPLVKEWVSLEDSKVRPSHAKANGQIREIGDAFSVGGFPMSHPGDMTAPAKETVNCRCISLVHPVIGGRVRK